MAHASIWFTTKEEAAETMADFAAIAKKHGYTNERGPAAGEGNVRELIEAINRGEVATVLLGDEERDAAIEELRQRADACELYAAQVAFRDIAEALDEARSREWEWMEKNEMTEIEVIYSISTNENDYTDDEAYHECVPALVDRIENEVTAYMKREYPHVEFDTRRVPETESYSNRSYPYSADEPGFAIIEELDNFVGNNWPDWFNEAAMAAEEQA